MWRDRGVGLLLASVTLMTVCAKDVYTEEKILNITVPRWIENGTNEQVILDCEYEYSPEEENLVIKWFLNEDSQAVYQWIPSINSRIFSDKFSPYIDWEYQPESGEKFTRYRQIALIRPTIEFRGIYQCMVNSILGHGMAEATLDVYAPAKNITLIYNTLTNNKVNVTCMVKKIFPKPEIQLFQVTSGSDDPKPIGKTLSFIKDNGIHGFDISVNAIISMYQLNSSVDTTFRCVVLIHEDVYKETREIIYHPSNEMAVLEQLYEKHNNLSPNTVSASFICIVFAIFMLL